jgi:ubiquinone/menaquinone biosynthesis C-methylase UbiE
MNKHLEKVKNHHDYWSETYDSSYFDNFKLYHRVTLENIKRFLPKNKNALILDAGGGSGIFTLELANMGYHVVLADISEGMLEKAEIKIREQGLTDKVKIMVSNILDMLEFEDEKFDFILCEGDPLSYCGDHHKAMKELVRVLKNGGRIIASVDNRVSAIGWLSKSDDIKAIEELLETGNVILPWEKEEHRYIIHAFTLNELKELFRSNGLTVEKITGKPVLAHRLSGLKEKKELLEDWLFDLELKFNDYPDYVTYGGHLEIVGSKNPAV